MASALLALLSHVYHTVSFGLRLHAPNLLAGKALKCSRIGEPRADAHLTLLPDAHRLLGGKVLMPATADFSFESLAQQRLHTLRFPTMSRYIL